MFHVDKFIEIVRNQPCLWDKSMEEYSNKGSRESAWIAVAELFYADWQYVALETTDERVKEMKMKWRNIRDTYQKFVNQTKSGEAASKRKKYVYAESLAFLLDTFEQRPARGCKKSLSTEGPLDDYTKSLDESSEVEEPTAGPGPGPGPCPGPGPGPGASQSQKPSPRVIKSQSQSAECQTEQTNNNTTQEQEQDADKMFLLSLLPDFKSMHEEDKLDFRITTLQNMRDVKRKRRMKTGGTT